MFTFIGFSQSTNNCSAVRDDFSNPSLWIHPTLGVNLQNPVNFGTLSVAGGQFVFAQSRDNNMNYLYRSGISISNSDFKANIDFRHTSNGTTAGGAGHVILALNSDNEPFFNSTSSSGGIPMSMTPLVLTSSIHNGIAVTFQSNSNVAPTNFFFQVYINNGGVITPAGAPISVGGPLLGGTNSDYFIELVRVGTTSGLLNVYSDAARTILINTSGLFAIPATIINFNTVQFGTNEWQPADRMLTGKLDNLCINNTTTASSPNLCNVMGDDFSNPSVWAHPILSSVLACNTLATMTINSGKFQFLQSRDNNFNFMNRSGLTISNTSFKADIDFEYISNGANAAGTTPEGPGHTILALNNGFKPFFSETSSVGFPGSACSPNSLVLTVAAQKGIAVTFESVYTGSVLNLLFKVYTNDGSGAFPTVASTTIAVGPPPTGGVSTNYYIRLERTSLTNGILSVYTNPARTSIFLIGSISFAIPSSIINLNTAQIGGNEWESERRMLTGNLDNLCINNTTPLSISNLEINNNDLVIFPNPANDFINVSANTIISKTEIYDFNGRLVFHSTEDKNQANLNLENISKGIYLLKITTKNGTETKKILKN